MRDDHYKALCSFTGEYDTVIDWIKRNNPYCMGMATEEQREDFATHTVNMCIRSVIYGDSGNFCSTGMCIAVRAGKSYPNDNQVLLAVRL